MRVRTVLLVIGAVVTTNSAAGDSDVLIQPTAVSGPPLGLVFVQGAQSPTAAYVPLAKAIQSASPFKMWVAIPAFPLDTPEPVVIGSGMKRAIASLRAAGLPASAPVAVAAHSLGGVMLQDWTYKNHEQVVAQLLMGSTLLRKYRNGSVADNYPVPTMMMSGTLDGLFRVTRQAESFYHYVTDHTKPVAEFPVTVFEGVAHWSFGSGPAPGLVHSHDLKPEVDEDAAHAMLGRVAADFLSSIITGNDTAIAGVAAAVESSAPIIAPIVAALQSEGFIHLDQPACNTDYPLPPNCPAYPRYPSGQQKGTNPPHCTCGTPWSGTAQQVMAGTAKVDVLDGVHPVSDISPIHLPHIWNNCSASEPDCVLQVTTVTYPIYAILDSEDTGFFSASASELRTKLKSRQSVQLAAGAASVNFTASDVVPSTCATINQAAWDWAMAHASAAASSRFANIGQPMKFGADIFLGNAGPVWIENPIEYKASADQSVLNVYSPCSHTPVDYPIASAAGYHYCKLVSPARALEHIYIDGLRPKGGLPPL